MEVPSALGLGAKVKAISRLAHDLLGQARRTSTTQAPRAALSLSAYRQPVPCPESAGPIALS